MPWGSVRRDGGRRLTAGPGVPYRQGTADTHRTWVLIGGGGLPCNRGSDDPDRLTSLSGVETGRETRYVPGQSGCLTNALSMSSSFTLCKRVATEVDVQGWAKGRTPTSSPTFVRLVASVRRTPDDECSAVTGTFRVHAAGPPSGSTSTATTQPGQRLITGDCRSPRRWACHEAKPSDG